ncbi:MAG: M15 family metallopeptidase [Ruminococcus flavefaciens]|nr:M15 family metallopeptidase [Ruminococcus flavefaciens]
MNKGSQRRKKRKYRVRYDRVVAVLLALIVMIVVITSCVKGILKKDTPPDDDISVSDSEPTSTAPETPETPPETTSADTPEEVITTEPVSEIITTTTTATTTTETTTETTTTTTTTAKKEPLPEGYTNVSMDSNGVYSGDLLVVNGNHIYQFPTDDTNIVTLYDHIKTEYYGVSDFEVKLDEEVIQHLNELMQDFAETQHNTDIFVIGGYRSAEDQNQRYSNGISGVIGGFSDYHTGRSFDMGVFPQDGSSSGYYSPTGIYAWIDEHASDYGFVVRFPEGKEMYTNERARTQTYRYVGVPHSTYMKQNNLCLEEYIDKIKSYTMNKPLEISSGTSLYKVYYVASDYENTTDVGVPLGEDYEISGNNEDGFIVTVKVH